MTTDQNIAAGDSQSKPEMNDLAPSDPAIRPDLSFGQKLVGISFNPSNDERVDKAKTLCAALADLANSHWEGKDHTRLENQLYDHTIGEILNAQMNVVKLLTLKY